MAGGRSDGKQSGNLDKTHRWHRHYHRFDFSVKSDPPANDGFRKRKSAEHHRTVVNNINLLQESILRLLYSNLDFTREEQLLVEIILNTSYECHFFNESSTSIISHVNERICERCLTSNCDAHQRRLREAAGHVAADAITASSEMADSGLETGSASPNENTASENSSADLEITRTTEYASANDDDPERPRSGRVACSKGASCKRPPTEDDEHRENGATRSESSGGSSSSSSSSGSRSATTYSSPEAEHQPADSSANVRKVKLNADEIFQYESRVLREPFYESDCGSDENESFEFVESAPSNASGDRERTDVEKRESDRKALPPSDAAESASEATATTTGTEFERPLLADTSHGNSSGYYFIDASTLNDEVTDIVPANATRNRYRCDNCADTGGSPSHFAVFSDYVTNDRSSNIAQEQQLCKFTPLKTSAVQSTGGGGGGHEQTAEFERELRLTECLRSLPESREVKRPDPASEEEKVAGAAASRPADKESLAVEIKEMDSGESSHPSPCPDNNARMSNDRDEKRPEGETSSCVEQAATAAAASSSSSSSSENANEDRRPSLIRRNTFELDSNDEKLSVLRQEYERRQGSLVFQSSIPQYSGHRVDGDSLCPVAPPDTVVPPVAEPPPPPPPPPPSSSSITYASTDVQIVAPSTRYPVSYLLLEHCEYEVDRTSRKQEGCPRNDNLERSRTAYPVTKSASDKSIVADHGTDSASNRCSSSSLPVTLGSILERRDSDRAECAKRNKRDEATPIISGGVSTSDYSRPTDSPSVRRKTESTPIVSGGSVIMSKPEVKAKPARMSSSMTAWVVDMSDCSRSGGDSKARGGARNMSQSFSASECAKKPARRSNIGERHHCSLGFFVNLRDTRSVESVDRRRERCGNGDKSDSGDSGKPYCEFYVDISDDGANNGVAKKPSSERRDARATNGGASNGEGEEKKRRKNIFSMFIDLNDTSETSSGAGDAVASSMHRRGFPTVPDQETADPGRTDDSSSRENSSAAAGDNQSPREQRRDKSNKPSPVFMFIESDSPVVRRRTLSTSRPTFKRHSWNVDKTQQPASSNGCLAKELMFRREHKRAHSVSIDNRGDSARSTQAKTSSSSHSLSDAAKADCRSSKALSREREHNSNNMDTSSEDVFELDAARDTPPNSHVEIESVERLRVGVASRREHKETTTVPASAGGQPETGEAKASYDDELSELSAWEKTCTESTEGGQTRKSETFDISSGSGPSPDSDNREYELTTDLLNGCEVPVVGDRPQIVAAAGGGNKISETRKSLNETIKKIECELKEPEYNDRGARTHDRCRPSRKDERIPGRDSQSSRHSDADLTGRSSFVRLSDLDKTPIVDRASDASTVTDDRGAYRVSSSIPETSWIESKLAMARNSGPVRPVSRKLVSAMSASLPSKQKSPLEDLTGDGEGEGIISESDLSSMQSSMGRSGAEGSTEETETSSIAGAKPYNRLGEDLLRMFLEEINPDVTIDVAGRHIRAHKCILSSRCQYFAAILSGGWIESAGNVISLQGYSYNAVHFALCHIYSGESNIPDSISIVELATLADMLCLEGLKEVIEYTLKLKYCHLFHKPCQICAVGVLECMPLAAAYGLDEVYRKSLRWVTKHFVRIWPCKAFATLPRELMEKCYRQHVVHMSTDNVLQTMMDCDKLLATLPNVRWAEPVFRLVSRLLEKSVKFLSDNFVGVLGNENFQSLGRELTWNISRLEDNFLAAVEQLPPEQACKSYSKLNKMLLASQTDDLQDRIKWGPLFVDFLRKLQGRVEKCLVRDASHAARTTTWLKMDLELRRRIQELACIVILPNEISKPRQSRPLNFAKESRAPSSRSTISRSLDLKRFKMAMSEHNDKTLKQTPPSKPTKKVLCKPKTDPLERKMQEDKQVNNETIRPKSWPNKMEVKSRYLEPRNKSVPKENTPMTTHHDKINVQQRRKIMISSSDSSRTSSPAMKRASDKKPLAKIKLPVKKDVKALSSDSLTEANPSRTGNKKDLISKSCGITRPESPSFKQKSAEIGLSVDSLETKSKPVTTKKKANKMDTSMSTDSLMTEITATPKSNVSNKLSPTLTKVANKTQAYDRTKKNSPPTQQRSPLTVTKRPARSLESSTAASRSRAAAINAYHGSPSLRRNLLDAAKTPDVPSKPVSTVTPFRTRQIAQSNVLPNTRRERKETQNSQSSDSPSKKSSPKSSIANKMTKSTVTGKRTVNGKIDDKVKRCHNGETQKQPTVGSRSGTFLKDEPTILKKTAGSQKFQHLYCLLVQTVHETKTTAQ